MPGTCREALFRSASKQGSEAASLPFVSNDLTLDSLSPWIPKPKILQSFSYLPLLLRDMRGGHCSPQSGSGGGTPATSDVGASKIAEIFVSVVSASGEDIGLPLGKLGSALAAKQRSPFVCSSSLASRPHQKS